MIEGLPSMIQSALAMNTGERSLKQDLFALRAGRAWQVDRRDNR